MNVFEPEVGYALLATLLTCQMQNNNINTIEIKISFLSSNKNKDYHGFCE